MELFKTKPTVLSDGRGLASNAAVGSQVIEGEKLEEKVFCKAKVSVADSWESCERP